MFDIGSQVTYHGSYKPLRGKTATVVEPRVGGALADRWRTIRFDDGTVLDAGVEGIAADKPKCGHGHPVGVCPECDRLEEEHRIADSDARWNAGRGR